MIGAACAQLGERALVCSGSTDFGKVPDGEHVKVVGVVDYARPFFRLLLRDRDHHGGAEHLAAGLRGRSPPIDPLDVALISRSLRLSSSSA